MATECPHCGKANCIADVAYHNAEAYGSQHFTMRCMFCRAPIRVYLVRKVVCVSIDKAPPDAILDWT